MAEARTGRSLAPARSVRGAEGHCWATGRRGSSRSRTGGPAGCVRSSRSWARSMRRPRIPGTGHSRTQSFKLASKSKVPPSPPGSKPMRRCLAGPDQGLRSSGAAPPRIGPAGTSSRAWPGRCRPRTRRGAASPVRPGRWVGGLPGPLATPSAAASRRSPETGRGTNHPLHAVDVEVEVGRSAVGRPEREVLGVQRQRRSCPARACVEAILPWEAPGSWAGRARPGRGGRSVRGRAAEDDGQPVGPPGGRGANSTRLTSM